MEAPPQDAPVADVRQIIESALSHHFGEVRRCLLEDLRNELQGFLSTLRHAPNPPAPDGGKRRFSNPSPRRLSAGSLLSPARRTGSFDLAPCPPKEPPPQPAQPVVQQSIHEEDDGHAWMHRHIRRFNSMLLGDDDDDDDDIGAVPPQPQRASRQAPMPQQASRRSEPPLDANRLRESAQSRLSRGKSLSLEKLSGSAPSDGGGYGGSTGEDARGVQRLQRSESYQTSVTSAAFDDSPKDAWLDGGCDQPMPPVACESSQIGFKTATAKGLLRRSSKRFDLPITGRVQKRGGILQRSQRAARRLVRSHQFDYFVCALILLNAITIGVSTNYAATRRTADLPREFTVFELIFCAAFSAEILLRLFVHRCTFFHRKGWEWNIFDLTVVLLQVAEICLGTLPNLSFVRMLRVLRLIRAIRLIRILRHITELRALVASIGASLASLVWTLVLLMLMIYMLSLCITQLVVDHRLYNIEDDDAGQFQDMLVYYGSLTRTMLSLFQAVSGGVDWDSCVSPLMMHVSAWLAPLFSLYIAFTLLALMNVVTAMFVESVIETTKKDRNVFMANNVRELFNSVDGGLYEGAMDWDTFQSKLDTQPMVEFFKAIDIDRSEATCLFRLLDLDNGGSVDAEEFLSGCLRLRGPAKALDLALLISEVGKIAHSVKTRDSALGSVPLHHYSAGM